MTYLDEVDFGYWWSDTPKGFPRYRVTWNPNSGDLYASSHASHDAEIFCRVSRREDLDSLMDGWWAEMHKPCSLEWIRSRVSERADELAGLTGGDR